MRNLLQIISAVISEIGFGTPPTVVVASTDPTIMQMLALANREGYELSTMDGMNEGWPILRREFTFPTVIGQESYAFPDDYQYIVGQTEWDRDQHWQLVGPATPQEWQLIKSGLSPIGPRRRFIIKQGSLVGTDKYIFLDPVPTTVNTIVFEYISINWVISALGATTNTFSLDTDSTLLDEQLMILGIIWRFLRAKGLPYDEEYKTYMDTKQTVMARAGASRPLPLGGKSWDPILLSNANIPDTGFGI